MKWRTDIEFLTIGVLHFRVWTVTGLGLLCNTITIPLNINGILLTCGFYQEETYIGDATGNLQVWSNNKYKYSLPSQEGVALDAMYVREDIVVTGGRDHKINIFQ